jgi:thiamine kinase-like enzyme
MNNKVEQVRQYYEEEKQRNFRPLTLDDLPGSYDALTTEWLTNLLCRDTPEAEVISFDLDEVDNGSANRRRINLTYNDAGQAAGLPASVFCKAAFELINRINLGISRSGENEVHFYAKLRDELPILAPKAYFSALDMTSWKSLIILEDMAKSVEFCDETTEMDFEKASSQMDLLARLHGFTHSHPDYDRVSTPFVSWQELWKKQVDLGMDEYCDKGFAAAESVLPSSVFQYRNIVWELTNRAVQISRAMPNMITHNDVHLKNWYIAPGNKMGLSDWHTLSKNGNGFRDFAYTISTALTIDNRRKWEKDLLALYLEKLKAHSGPAFEFENAWLQYRQQLISALSYWTITLCPSPNQPDMQPEHTTMVFLSRIGAAMEDLDTIASLK